MKKEPIIGIVDYGVGNLHSAVKAFKQFSSHIIISEDAPTLMKCNALVLPGVGSFESGMEGLRVRGLIDTIINFSKSNTMILGICLGAQIMLSRGFEFGEFNGLNLIEGEVRHFPKLIKGVKIPHVGWNKIYPPGPKIWDNSIFKDIEQGSNVYFVHSYALHPKNPKHVFATTQYGKFEFCSAIRKGNIYGTQFHPEKSGKIGLAIIKKFIESI